MVLDTRTYWLTDQIVTSSNYNALAISCTRLLTTAHKSSQYVFDSRCLVTVPNNADYSSIVFMSLTSDNCFIGSPQLATHCLWLTMTQGQSQSHIETDGQSVIHSWCWAPLLVPVWQLLPCKYGAPSLKRRLIYNLSEAHYVSIRMCNMFTFYMILKLCAYNVYKATVIPGSVHQIMPYLQ
jgi:hypothetical protein